MKLLRVVRLDPSDTFVFERAAEAGEWAVSAAALFAHASPDAMTTKERHAFRSGFLGVASLGFATLAEIVEVDANTYGGAIETLAAQMHARLGAPDLETARQAARAEVDFAASLCDHAPGVIVAVRREMDGEGALREQFRVLQPRALTPGADGLHGIARAFTFHEIEETQPDERVDLVALAGARGADKGGEQG